VVRSSVGRRQRNPQDGVGPEVLLVLRAVQLDHATVQADLVQCAHADQLVGQPVIDVGDRLGDPFAKVLLFVAVPQFPGLVDPGAGPAGDRRTAERSVGQGDVDFDGGVASAIQNLPGVDVYDRRAHGSSRLS